VSWTTSPVNVVTIDPSTYVPDGAALGTTTITASAQGLQATATATVYLTGISQIKVTPNQVNWSISGGTLTSQFTAQATAGTGSVDITSGAIWTVTPPTTSITCSFQTPDEVCTGQSGVTAQTYTLTVTYPGTTNQDTAQIIVGH
jgi:hypothetical protein